MNTIKINYDSIVNYFDKRSTNASAEMKFMNSKIKQKTVNNPSMLKLKHSEINLEE
ncbi:hypothetical protein SAMN05444395_1281 [Flavobacterium fryxellicola]|uniref:transposase n=1 Tax=Flavobacterium fryxellicola TaxID=249352 RepID=UPI00091FA4F6|nr:transposase [Flavobacterium fryxellicola]SHN80424.1 hypothetical protein SAMN05444395_1281 [Flavobacterium fryxellicola]